MNDEKEHWTDLILESVGDDPEKAEEFYTQYKLWAKNTLIAVALTFGIMCIIVAGVIFGMYWCGVETDNPPGERELISLVFLWMGALMGSMCAILNGSLETKLRKRAENTKYYAGRIEREKGEDQCK